MKEIEVKGFGIGSGRHELSQQKSHIYGLLNLRQNFQILVLLKIDIER